MWISCPEIQRPAGEMRNDTMPAMSDGVPSRPSGWSGTSAVRVASSIHPVSIGPGLTTFAEIPAPTKAAPERGEIKPAGVSC